MEKIDGVAAGGMQPDVISVLSGQEAGALVEDAAESVALSGLQVFRRGGQSDDWLKLSLDRKVSPDGWFQEPYERFPRGRWVPTIPNSFGLPAGESCPGETEFCNGCYAKGSENGGSVKDLVEHNFNMLQEAGSVEGMTVLLDEMVDRYVRFADEREVPQHQRLFRIHWDGDFFSEDYARAWADVIRDYPDIKFWTYTRSFVDPVDVVPHLAGIDNLALYLSTDKYNVDVAHEVAEAYPDVRLALCAEDYRSARELARPAPVLTDICPENSGEVPLMSGKKHDLASGIGACVTCRWCVVGNRDVIFSTSHQEDANPQLELFGNEVPVELSKKPARSG